MRRPTRATDPRPLRGKPSRSPGKVLGTEAESLRGDAISLVYDSRDGRPRSACNMVETFAILH